MQKFEDQEGREIVIPPVAVSPPPPVAVVDQSGTLNKRPHTPQQAPKWEDDIDFGESIVFEQPLNKPKHHSSSTDHWSGAVSPDPSLLKQTQPFGQNNYSSQPYQSSKMSVASSDAEDIEERPQVGALLIFLTAH